MVEACCLEVLMRNYIEYINLLYLPNILLILLKLIKYYYMRDDIVYLYVL